MTAIELHDATKVYENAQICASLQIASGRQTVLLGPSGCGKSTVLRMIAGLIEPDKGEVRFDGRSMRSVRPELRDAAMVFQSHALFPFRTVKENVEYGLKVRKIAAGERAERTMQAMRVVQLEGFADRWPGDLSGGERQRVALARAIVVEPKVLLLDEPLSSLDPVLRVELRQLICELQQQLNITTIFVTHDREEARAVGDEIAVMLAGRIHQVGPPDTVFNHPANDRVATFLGSDAGMRS